MELNEEQKQLVREWVMAGEGLAEIQRRIGSEFDISMTYMDVRFLVLDLGVDVHDKPEPTPAPNPAAAAPADAAREQSSPAVGGGVSVDLDVVTKPGSVVSGTVVFSDGVSAAWSLDQLGRLAISGPEPGYQPSPEDIQAFQLELKAALEKRGF